MREGYDCLFVISHESEGHDLRGKGENCTNGPVRMETEMNDLAVEMEAIKLYVKHKHAPFFGFLIAFTCLYIRGLERRCNTTS